MIYIQLFNTYKNYCVNYLLRQKNGNLLYFYQRGTSVQNSLVYIPVFFALCQLVLGKNKRRAILYEWFEIAIIMICTIKSSTLLKRFFEHMIN